MKFNFSPLNKVQKYSIKFEFKMFVGSLNFLKTNNYHPTLILQMRSVHHSRSLLSIFKRKTSLYNKQDSIK